MNVYLKHIILFSFLLNVVDVNCQIIKPTGALVVDVSIPTKGKNATFGKTMEGLFHGGIGYRHNVYKGLNIGAGLNYSFFISNKISLNQTMGGGGTHIPGAHLKIGYEKFTTNRVSFYGGLKPGYGALIVENDSCELSIGGPSVNYAPFLELQFEINMLTDLGSSDAFNILMGYSFYFTEFNQDFLCRSYLPGILPENSLGLTRFFNIGFGYRYYFNM